MGYTSKRGRRPDESASKSAHSHVIKDEVVQAFLASCNMPKRAEAINLSDHQLLTHLPASPNPIRHVIAIDGGYSEVAVRTEFPSATICFFQFGALIFSVEDLDMLEESSFIDPDDMAKLKRIQRLKLTLPVRNVALKNQTTLTASVRYAIYDFFIQNIDDDRLIDTLRWFIFAEYSSPVAEWILATCPNCEHARILLQRALMTTEHTFNCSNCNDEILLTDVFRLHEAIDDELGAGGILGYVTTTLEQIILVHFIRLLLRTKPALMREIMFIKDGPLAFFGQTANMYKPMRDLSRFLFKHHNIYLAGLEKSGAFVEHADEIVDRLEEGQILLLDNDYIYRYVLPGKADSANPYGRTTYYGNKLIFKAHNGGVYVVTLPTTDTIANPNKDDLKNLDVILTNVEKLKCDMYDSALLPVALANKLVSLANHPSSRILQKFAVGSLHS